jgi:hypothetical protein
MCVWGGVSLALTQSCFKEFADENPRVLAAFITAHIVTSSIFKVINHQHNTITITIVIIITTTLPPLSPPEPFSL